MAVLNDIPGINGPLLQVALTDPVTGQPLGSASAPLRTTTNTPLSTSDLTTARFQITTAATTVISTAAAGVATRVYRLRLNTALANKITIQRGSTVLEVLNFTGPGFVTYDFATRPWYSTNANETLNLVTSVATETNLVIEFTKVA